MFLKVFVLLFLVLGSVETHGHSHNKLNSLNGSHLAGIEFPDHMSFNDASSVTSGCNLQQSGPLMDEEDEEEKVLRLQLKHRRHKDQTVQETAARDRSRIHTIHKRIIEKKNQENPVSRLHKDRRLLLEKPSESTLMLATLESGVSLGSGEYFMDVFAVTGKRNLVDTFYYVQVKSILVADEILNIPNDLWSLSSEGAGGTIIDSGTTLSYFAEPAYGIIKEAFVKNVKKYPRVKDFPILDPCYNVSGVEKLELPELQILFGDGAVWNFPVENSFISITDEVVCLAILGTPRSAISIIGNYQQQNFHILYDTKNSRLGFAPRNCAHV